MHAGQALEVLSGPGLPGNTTLGVGSFLRPGLRTLERRPTQMRWFAFEVVLQDTGRFKVRAAIMTGTRGNESEPRRQRAVPRAACIFASSLLVGSETSTFFSTTDRLYLLLPCGCPECVLVLASAFSVTQASNLCLSGCQPASTVSGCSSRIGSFWTQCACFHLGQKTNRLPDPTWMLPGQVPPGGRLVPRVAGDPQHNPGDCDG